MLLRRILRQEAEAVCIEHLVPTASAVHESDLHVPMYLTLLLVIGAPELRDEQAGMCSPSVLDDSAASELAAIVGTDLERIRFAAFLEEVD